MASQISDSISVMRAKAVCLLSVPCGAGSA